MLVLRKINCFNRGLLQSQFMRREKNYKSVFLALGHSRVLRKINSFNRGLLQSHFWRWEKITKPYFSLWATHGCSGKLIRKLIFEGGEKKLQIRIFGFGLLMGAPEN